MWWSSLGRFWPYRTCNSDWSHKNLRGRLQNVGGGGSRISGGDVRCSFRLLLSLLEHTVFDLLSTVLCKKVQRPACNCRFLLMLMFIFCFPQRRSLLAVYWGAETCQMTYFVFFLSPLHLLLIIFSYSQSVSVTFLKFLLFLLHPLCPFLYCFCGSVLSVLWRRSPDSVHPVSPSGSPRSWLPAPPETCHFPGLQHSVLPLCPLYPCTKLQPGHSTER